MSEQLKCQCRPCVFWRRLTLVALSPFFIVAIMAAYMAGAVFIAAVEAGEAFGRAWRGEIA